MRNHSRCDQLHVGESVEFRQCLLNERNGLLSTVGSCYLKCSAAQFNPANSSFAPARSKGPSVEELPR